MFRSAVLAAIALPFAAQADSPDEHLVVRIDCDAAHGRLEVSNLVMPGPDGGRIKRISGRTEVSPGGLAWVDAHDGLHTKAPVRMSCVLGRERYALRIGATLQGARVTGHCGAADIPAWIEVSRDGRVVLPRRELGPDCAGQAPVTTRIVFDVGSASPTVSTVAADEFAGASPSSEIRP